MKNMPNNYHDYNPSSSCGLTNTPPTKKTRDTTNCMMLPFSIKILSRILILGCEVNTPLGRRE
jgi:hypothetical protein